MITTLLAWYDEQPEWLDEAVASVSGFSHQIVAVDGAYMLFPDARRRSESAQTMAIMGCAHRHNMGCTIVEPTRPWLGNEIEKRSTMFAIAEQLTQETDWYLVLDADELVVDVLCPDLLERLDALTQPVVDVMVRNGGERRQFPKFFRALRGLHAYGNHWTYQLPDGRRLWGHGHRGQSLQFAADFTKIVTLEHRTLQRSQRRAEAAQAYYASRSAAAAEFDG